MRSRTKRSTRAGGSVGFEFNVYRARRVNLVVIPQIAISHKGLPLIARLAFAVVSIALVAAAYLRGNYLLGLACGIAYAFVTSALIWLFIQSFTRKGRVSWIQAIAILILSVPVGFAMAFPAAINSDVQHGIDDQATDRKVRAELKRVFASDAAFAKLSLSTVHLKVVNVTIRGPLRTRSDLERLRSRISSECPTLELCPLHWDVELRDSGEGVDGLDRELFSSAEYAE